MGKHGCAAPRCYFLTHRPLSGLLYWRSCVAIVEVVGQSLVAASHVDSFALVVQRVHGKRASRRVCPSLQLHRGRWDDMSWSEQLRTVRQMTALCCRISRLTEIRFEGRCPIIYFPTCLDQSDPKHTARPSYRSTGLSTPPTCLLQNYWKGKKQFTPLQTAAAISL